MIVKERVKYLENYLYRLKEEGVFPGAVFGLITREESYFNAIGKSQVIPVERDMNVDTVFDLASLSKVISTTTAILLLQEMGLLTIDTRVKELLPEYKYEDITIKQLLTHTSGHQPDLDYKKCKTKHEIVKMIFDEKIDESKRDREVIYSDIGFLLLGLIVDKITGSLAEFTGENIFMPLEMENTFYNPPAAKMNACAATEYCHIRKELINGKVHDEKAFLMDGVAGHAGLFSTVQDLGNFCRMILNDGLFDGKTILTKNSIDLMSRLHTVNLNSNRGLGWALKEIGSSCGHLVSDNAIYHTGFTGTSVLIDRYYGKAFILLTNRVHPTRVNVKLINERAKINNIAISSVF